MEKKPFKTGQTVYSPLWEGGKELLMSTMKTHPFKVDCGDGRTYWFFKRNGTPDTNNPILLFHEPVEIIKKKWKPQPGELCWFWDEDNERDGNIGATVSTYKAFYSDNHPYLSDEGSGYKYCSPFTEPPKHIAKLIK